MAFSFPRPIDDNFFCDIFDRCFEWPSLAILLNGSLEIPILLILRVSRPRVSPDF